MNWSVSQMKVNGLLMKSPPKSEAGCRSTNVPAGCARHSRMPKDAPGKARIWFDLDNTPHVPLFEPVIEELEAGLSGARHRSDAFQVCELADQKGLQR